jgi:hypothetical protein
MESNRDKKTDLLSADGLETLDMASPDMQMRLCLFTRSQGCALD